MSDYAKRYNQQQFQISKQNPNLTEININLGPDLVRKLSRETR